MESTTKLAVPAAGRNQLETAKGEPLVGLLRDMMQSVLSWLDVAKAKLDQTYVAVRKLRTTDATATEIWASTMRADSAWDMEWTVIGYSTGDEYAAYKRLTRVEYDGTTATAATDVIGTDREDVAAWTTTIAAAADGVVNVTVTGAASTTIDWTIRVTIQEARQGQ